MRSERGRRHAAERAGNYAIDTRLYPVCVSFSIGQFLAILSGEGTFQFVDLGLDEPPVTQQQRGHPRLACLVCFPGDFMKDLTDGLSVFCQDLAQEVGSEMD